jgi:anti-anti-sigma factor
VNLNLDDFKIKIIDDIAIVIVEILVATHRDAKPLWDELESKSILGWDKIIIDISNCTFVDSTFIGMIVKIYKSVSNRNGDMKLVFPEKKAMAYIHHMGITKILDCFNTLNQAVNSFDTRIPTRKIVFQEELPNN